MKKILIVFALVSLIITGCDPTSRYGEFHIHYQYALHSIFYNPDYGYDAPPDMPSSIVIPTSDPYLKEEHLRPLASTEHFAFDKWVDIRTNKPVNVGDKLIAPITVIASWVKIKPLPEDLNYSITFSINNFGYLNNKPFFSLPKDQSDIPYGTILEDVLPMYIDDDNFIFDGWYAGEEKYTSRTVCLCSDLDMVARFIYKHAIKMRSSEPQELVVVCHGNATIPNSMEYSVDDANDWHKLEAGVPIPFCGTKILYIRGESPTGTASENGTDYIQFTFTTNALVECSGDLANLVTKKPAKTADTAKARFCNLFKGCEVLTLAPELSSPTLATNCYNSLFFGCTKLESVPELTALSLPTACYYQMFANCSSLKEITMLATTINGEQPLENWLMGVNTQGTLTVATSEMASSGTILGSLPSSWSVKVKE